MLEDDVWGAPVERSVVGFIGKPVYESEDELEAKEGSRARAFQVGSFACEIPMPDMKASGIGGAVGMVQRLAELSPMAG